MRTGTFHTFDRYIYHQNIHLFLVYKEVLFYFYFLVFFALFFLSYCWTCSFQKNLLSCVDGYGYDSFRPKKGRKS